MSKNAANFHLFRLIEQLYWKGKRHYQVKGKEYLCTNHRKLYDERSVPSALHTWVELKFSYST